MPVPSPSTRGIRNLHHFHPATMMPEHRRSPHSFSFRWVASTTTILARLALEPDAGAGVVHTINLLSEARNDAEMERPGYAAIWTPAMSFHAFSASARSAR